LRKLFLIFYILFFLTLIQISSQTLNPETIEYRYWIYFKDKGVYKPGETIEAGSDAYKIAVSGLSDKAIWRRSKVLGENKIVSYIDLPVNPDYIEKVKSLGVKPHAISKWFNAVSVQVLKGKLDEIKKLPFVEKIEGVHFLETVKILFSSKKVFPSSHDIKSNTKYNYGFSYWQNEQINVTRLHNFGITGYGVRVGMCDDGFNWRNHQALKTRKVLGEYDWIFKDDSTLNQTPPNQVPADVWDQDGHGTATMSSLGGYYPGKFVGPAFDVEFYLSKTENDATETPVEEDFYLEAVEWMEANGIEVISSSLIYKPYDPPNNGYTYKDMDGKTTVIVRAADIAASLGIVVLNSMGNEYQTEPPSIVSPPDGEHVIAVGAVDSAGRIAYFSSNGPTSDGRTKPDVVAMGVDVYTAVSLTSSLNDSAYSYSSGTSFSCPLTSGVCALVLSAHPELTPDQVKEALKMTANNKDNPNNVYGWGLVNAYDAALYYGMIMSNKPEISVKEESVEFTIYVISKDKIEPTSVKINYIIDNEKKFAQMELDEKINETNSGKYKVILPVNIISNPITFYFSASDTKSSVMVPYNAPNKFFYYNQEIKAVEIF